MKNERILTRDGGGGGLRPSANGSVQSEVKRIKVCSHLTFAFASTSSSKFNIVSMEMQKTQTHRVGLNVFLTFYIDAMLNFDANANVKCEHTII